MYPYHPATFVLIDGLRKFGSEGRKVLDEWDRVRYQFDSQFQPLQTITYQRPINTNPYQYYWPNYVVTCSTGVNDGTK